MPDDTSESSPVQFFVVRDNYLSKGIISTENHVTSFLPFKIETQFFNALTQLWPET